MIGEIAIYLAEQFNHFATQCAKDAWRTGACNAVARIDHNFQGAAELNAVDNSLSVSRHDVVGLDTALTRQGPRLDFDHLAQGLNLIAINGTSTQHHLETIVIFWVMAARDLYAAVTKGVRCKIKLWRGRQAYINDFDTNRHQTAHEGA